MIRSLLVRGPGTGLWLLRSDGRRITYWAHASGTRAGSNAHHPGPEWMQVSNVPPGVARAARGLLVH
jgi:hypothetical protein